MYASHSTIRNEPKLADLKLDRCDRFDTRLSATIPTFLWIPSKTSQKRPLALTADGEIQMMDDPMPTSMGSRRFLVLHKHNSAIFL